MHAASVGPDSDMAGRAPLDAARDGRHTLRCSARVRRRRWHQFELHQDAVDQHRQGRAMRVDHEMRTLAVQRIALGVERLQLLERVATLQQRSLRVVAQPPVELLGRRAQVDHGTALAQVLPIDWPQHRAAARRQYRRRASRQRVDDFGFVVAESGLALCFEKAADRHAKVVLDYRIGIKKRQLAPARELPSQSGLAGTRQAHEGDHGLSQVRVLS